MNPTAIEERTVRLPDRPWLIGGGKAVGLVKVRGHSLIPVFRTAADARAFMARLGAGVPGHFYPVFPDVGEFVRLLAAAMRDGAEAYVFIEDGRWHVIAFSMASLSAAEPVELVGV